MREKKVTDLFLATGLQWKLSIRFPCPSVASVAEKLLATDFIVAVLLATEYTDFH